MVTVPGNTGRMGTLSVGQRAQNIKKRIGRIFAFIGV
jgi:hypothetical protein